MYTVRLLTDNGVDDQRPPVQEPDLLAQTTLIGLVFLVIFLGPLCCPLGADLAREVSVSP